MNWETLPGNGAQTKKELVRDVRPRPHGDVWAPRCSCAWRGPWLLNFSLVWAIPSVCLYHFEPGFSTCCTQKNPDIPQRQWNKNTWYKTFKIHRSCIKIEVWGQLEETEWPWGRSSWLKPKWTKTSWGHTSCLDSLVPWQKKSPSERGLVRPRWLDKGESWRESGQCPSKHHLG